MQALVPSAADADNLPMTHGTLLSLGHGYTAQALARRLLPRGWRIVGTTRDAGKAEALRAQGVEALVWPGAALGPALGDATHLLSSIAPTEDGDPVLNRLADEIAATDLCWAGYLSTTGVYGDHDGAWVDEATPPAPSTRRGAWRVVAERDWSALGLPLHVFRLAGIYGPGRGPFAKVRDGTARRIVKPGQVFSRIHVDDAARLLEASMSRPAPGTVCNVCDDDPAPPQDVIGHAAQLLGMQPPPEERWDEAALSDMARSFYAENKRVRNDRMRAILGGPLLYPDYRSGLEALIASGE